MLAQLCLSASAAIVLILGTAHLALTFCSNKLSPRDPGVLQQMKGAALVMSPQTTLWRAWTGFNASHSLGAMLFGLLYGYLCVFHLQLLLHDRFLLALGAAFLASLLVLASRYWFKAPVAGIGLSFVLYVAGALAGSA